MPDDQARDRTIVACLCAEWCTVCREYRSTFNALAAELHDTHFVWVDIEESAELLGEVDVDNFPTVLIGRDYHLCFFGPVVPLADVVRRLVMEARAGTPSRVHHAAEITELLGRIQRQASATPGADFR